MMAPAKRILRLCWGRDFRIGIWNVEFGILKKISLRNIAGSKLYGDIILNFFICHPEFISGSFL